MTRGALPCATRGLRTVPATRDAAQGRRTARGVPAALRGVLRASCAGSARSIAAQRLAHPASPRRSDAARPLPPLIGCRSRPSAAARPLNARGTARAPRSEAAIGRPTPKSPPPRALRGRGRPGGREATAVRRRRAERSRAGECGPLGAARLRENVGIASGPRARRTLTEAGDIAAASRGVSAPFAPRPRCGGGPRRDGAARPGSVGSGGVRAGPEPCASLCSAVAVCPRRSPPVLRSPARPCALCPRPPPSPVPPHPFPCAPRRSLPARSSPSPPVPPCRSGPPAPLRSIPHVRLKAALNLPMRALMQTVLVLFPKLDVRTTRACVAALCGHPGDAEGVKHGGLFPTSAFISLQPEPKLTVQGWLFLFTFQRPNGRSVSCCV